MLRVMVLLGMALAGYILVIEPMLASGWYTRAACWMNKGTYVYYGATEPMYARAMTATPMNRLRLEVEDARGCAPVGVCLPNVIEADRYLEEEVLRWRVLATRDALGSFVFERIGKEIEARLGLKEQVDPRDVRLMEARRQEADFCAAFLSEVRVRLPVGQMMQADIKQGE